MGMPAALLGCLAVSGCASVVPNSLRIEAQHASHVTQHEPFTSQPTRYGSSVAMVTAHWNGPAHTFMEVGEGLSLDRRYREVPSCGEVMGPREQFQARVGITIDIHH
jgi:hypothetical protein